MIKNTKGKKCLLLFPKGGKTKQKKRDKSESRRTGVSSLCGRDSRLLIHNSQFKTVQIDTDYRHMICLGFAPVCIDFFSFFITHPPTTNALRDMVVVVVVGWLFV